MIKLTNILNEEEKFRARSKGSGKIVVFKSKENMEKAVDAGKVEPLEKGSGKADDSDKVKGAENGQRKVKRKKRKQILMETTRLPHSILMK